MKKKILGITLALTLVFLNYSSLNGGQCWNFSFVSVALIDSEIVDWFYNVTRRVLSLTQNLLRDWLRRIPDFTGFEISGEARQAESAMASGVDKYGVSISVPPFRHVSRMRLLRDLTGSPGPMRQPLGSGSLKSGEAEASALCVPILLLLPLAPSPRLASPLSTPPLRRHGEGENGGARTREEGDGGGEK